MGVREAFPSFFRRVPCSLSLSFSELDARRRRGVMCVSSISAVPKRSLLLQLSFLSVGYLRRSSDDDGENSHFFLARGIRREKETVC